MVGEMDLSEGMVGSQSRKCLPLLRGKTWYHTHSTWHHSRSSWHHQLYPGGYGVEGEGVVGRESGAGSDIIHTDFSFSFYLPYVQVTWGFGALGLS